MIRWKGSSLHPFSPSPPPPPHLLLIFVSSQRGATFNPRFSAKLLFSQTSLSKRRNNVSKTGRAEYYGQIPIDFPDRNTPILVRVLWPRCPSLHSNSPQIPPVILLFSSPRGKENDKNCEILRDAKPYPSLYRLYSSRKGKRNRELKILAFPRIFEASIFSSE